LYKMTFRQSERRNQSQRKRQRRSSKKRGVVHVPTPVISSVIVSSSKSIIVNGANLSGTNVSVIINNYQTDLNLYTTAPVSITNPTQIMVTLPFSLVVGYYIVQVKVGTTVSSPYPFIYTH